MNRWAHQQRQADTPAIVERLAAAALGEEVAWDSDDVESATSTQHPGESFFEQFSEDMELDQEDEEPFVNEVRDVSHHSARPPLAELELGLSGDGGRRTYVSPARPQSRPAVDPSCAPTPL